MNPALTYILNHKPDLIVNLVFTLLGTAFGLIFTPKDSSSSRSTMPMVQATTIIQQNIFQYQANTPTSDYETSQSKSDDNLGIIIFLVIFAAVMYAKYHILIMEYFVGFTFLSLASAITIAIKLNLNNNLDEINKFWLKLIFLIILVDFINLFLMSAQDVKLGNLYLLMKVIYYTVGFSILVFSNLLMIAILIYLYSLNSFLASYGKISSFFLRKTMIFTQSYKSTRIAIIAFIIFSLLFSSGLAYNFIMYLNNLGNKNTTNFINNLPK